MKKWFKPGGVALVGLLILAGVTVTAFAADPTPAPAPPPPGASGPGGFGMHRGIGGFGFLSDAVTQLLGMTRDQVYAELKAGKSLAQVAQAKGVSEQKLIDTIVADTKARFDKLVADGKITAAQRDARLQGLADRAKAMVERTAFGAGGMHSGWGGMGGLHLGWISDAVTQLLGMTRDQILTELKSGKSLAQVAQAKGVSEQKLIDTIVGDTKASLDKLVADGKITAAQRDARLQGLADRVKAMVERIGFGVGGMHRGRGGMGGFGLVSDAVTQLLGMTRDQILAELKAGKSLAQVAQAKGVSEQQLIDTIVADMKAKVEKLVADGKITRAQADARLQALADRVMAMVERTGFGRIGVGPQGFAPGPGMMGKSRGDWKSPGAQGFTPGPGMMGRARGDWNAPDGNSQGFAPGAGMMGRARGNRNAPDGGSQGFTPGQGVMGRGGRAS